MKKFLLPLFLLIFTFNYSFSQDGGIIKDIKILSNTVKLGDKLYLDISFNSVNNEELKLYFYLKKEDGSIIFPPLTKVVKADSKLKRIDIQIPESSDISAFYPEEAVRAYVYLRVDEKGKELPLGIINLYKEWHFSIKDIIRYGIVFPSFRIPFYVIFMSFLGGIGYMLINILKKPLFDIKEWKKRIIRPILGIILGIFIYVSASSIGLGDSEPLLCAVIFAAGFYISPVLYAMRNFIYSKLAPEKKLEDDLKGFSSELTEKLGMSKRTAYFLSKVGVYSVEDLISISEELIDEISKKYKVDKQYLTDKKKQAKDLLASEKNLQEV